MSDILGPLVPKTEPVIAKTLRQYYEEQTAERMRELANLEKVKIVADKHGLLDLPVQTLSRLLYGFDSQF